MPTVVLWCVVMGNVVALKKLMLHNKLRLHRIVIEQEFFPAKNFSIDWHKKFRSPAKRIIFLGDIVTGVRFV
jgi:hypothetical protein